MPRFLSLTVQDRRHHNHAARSLSKQVIPDITPPIGWIGPVLYAGAIQVSQEVFRYGIVGLGRAGWDIHIHELRTRPDARIVAVADPVQERRDQAMADFGCKAYTTFAPMLEQDDLDIIVVASPSDRHGPESKAAFKAGKHVVLEKPMATSIAEADSIIAAAEDADKKLFIHQNMRFGKEFLLLREAVASGKLGRIYHIRNYITYFARRNDWQTLAANGGGLLNNTGVHYLDQLLQLLPGKVTEVMGDLQQIASAGDVEDHVKALIRTDAGSTADVEIASAQNVATPLPTWIICGTTGTLTVERTNYTLRWFDPSQAPPLAARDGAAADRKYTNNDRLPWQEKAGPVEDARSIGTFYDNVVDVLKNNGQMVVTPQSVRETMRVISLIRAQSNSARGRG